MAKLKSAAPAPPQETATAAESTSASLFQGDETNGDSGSTGTAPAKSPTLVWNQAKDLALVKAYIGGAHTTATIAKAIASDPSFAGYPSKHVTAGKVRARVNKLRKRAQVQGEAFPLPALDREPGAGRPASGPRQIDFAALRAILQGAGSDGGDSVDSGDSNATV